MYKVDNKQSHLDKDQEDIIAENILKRAEIARITRQLRSKLLKAGIKARVDNGIPVAQKSDDEEEDDALSEPVFIPSSAKKRRSRVEAKSDDNDTEEYTSPLKKQHNLPSSSPLRSAEPPKTPPLRATTPEPQPRDIEEGSAQSALQNAIFATPKAKVIRHPYEFKTPTSSRLASAQRAGYENDQEEGADLLMFLATSPSPAYQGTKDYGKVSSPKNLSFGNVNSTPPRPLILTPGANKSPQYHRFTTPIAPQTPGRHKLQVGGAPKTPGFSMSDYVNLFTPSPRFNRTPDHKSTSTTTFLNLGNKEIRSLDQQLRENDSDRMF